MTIAELIEILKTMPQEAVVVAHSAEATTVEVGAEGVDLVQVGPGYEQTMSLLAVEGGHRQDAPYVFINGFPYPA